jgi:predicted dehydrogenase
MTPLTFGLIGLGHHGRNAVAPAFYNEAANVRLSAVCDVSPQALKTFERPVDATFTDYREMIDRSEIDAVYVAAGMDLHCGIVVDCLRAGKHVVVEKPMAATLDQCRTMIDTARETKRLLAVNFETRYSEQNEVLKRWIADGRFGRIDALHFANMWDGHKSFGPIKERRARLIGLAGALDCGIHKMDQARFLAGGTWKRVQALGAWLDEDFLPPPHIGIIAQLSNGVLVTLNASLSFAAHIEPRPMVNTMEIAGTEGVALCDIDHDTKKTTLKLYSKTLCETVEFGTTGHTSDIVLLLNDVVNAVENGPEAAAKLATGEDGYWAQFATEEANRSAIESRMPR